MRPLIFGMHGRQVPWRKHMSLLDVLRKLVGLPVEGDAQSPEQPAAQPKTVARSAPLRSPAPAKPPAKPPAAPAKSPAQAKPAATPRSAASIKPPVAPTTAAPPIAAASAKPAASASSGTVAKSTRPDKPPLPAGGTAASRPAAPARTAPPEPPMATERPTPAAAPPSPTPATSDSPDAALASGALIPSSLRARDALDHAPSEATIEAPARFPKPGSRRVALYDERLAPKPGRSPRKSGTRSKRLRMFTADEAARLFAPTLRTRNRALRALDIDIEQLTRYGLPIWRTEQDIATALQLELKALRHLSVHSATDRLLHYVTFALPKRSGGERLIMAPKKRLKALQRNLNTLLIDKLPVSEFAHGFRRARSVRSNAEPHVGKQVVLRMDLREFFPSIHFGRVRGLLISLGYGYPVATVLATLLTEAPRQPVRVGEETVYAPVGSRSCPQGAPTSPGLSNAICMKLDHRLAGLARARGFDYTRYADDLTFSGDDIDTAHALRLAAARLIEEEGFEVNHDKTSVMHASGRQRVTGVIVNRTLGLSRNERRTLRAALHRARQLDANGERDAALIARLRGKLAYLFMLNPQQAARLGKVEGAQPRG